MNRLPLALALIGALEAAWAFLSFGVDYFGGGAAAWLLALWAMAPLPLTLIAANRSISEKSQQAILAAGFLLALLAALALHVDAIRAFAHGREPLAGAAILIGPFYQYPLLWLTLTLAWLARKRRNDARA